MVSVESANHDCYQRILLKQPTPIQSRSSTNKTILTHSCQNDFSANVQVSYCYPVPRSSTNLRLYKHHFHLFHPAITHTLFLQFLITSLLINRSQSALSECNFDRYDTGCFSQANFVCDRDTNYCVCHPETPILVEERFCVKKAKANETCEYNQQCDNFNGYYCAHFSDVHEQFYLCPHDPSNLHKSPLASISSYEAQNRCRCLRVADRAERNQTPDGKQRHSAEDSWQLLKSPPLHNSWSSAEHKNNNKHTIPQSSNGHHHANHHHSGGSILPRLVWIFLIITLLSLIAFLFLIKFQSYRTDRPLHLADDRRSISSEPDVPPPYEVAIRMKL